MDDYAPAAGVCCVVYAGKLFEQDSMGETFHGLRLSVRVSESTFIATEKRNVQNFY